MNRRPLLPRFLALLTLLSAPPIGAAAQSVSFLNDVIPALTRAGCNQGPCHGAAAGKGGFRLSLRGYAPELDYLSITRQAGGRRITVAQPERSLLLRKPLMEVAHRGGQMLRPGTSEYRILRQWIQQGAPAPQPRDPRLVRLQVVPAEKVLAPKQHLQLRVRAHFSDGSSRDVTYWAHYGTNDENVAVVRDNGAARTTGPGETAITVAYQDKVAFMRVTVPFVLTPSPPSLSARSAPGKRARLEQTTLPFPSVQRISRAGMTGGLGANFIDSLIEAKLKQLRLRPSRLTTDTEFARRLYLDLIGTLPAPEALQAFAADRAPDKRERLVTTLMARPEFVDFWTYKWSDLLRVNRGTLKDKGMWAFYAWVQESVAQNKPWDQMAREVLTASGNTFLDGPANYFRTSQQTEELAENISQGFLGIRVQCAKCHNHPLEKWTQNEYYGMANLFARVGRKVDNAPWVNDEMIVYNLPAGDLVQPRLGRPVPPKPLGGPELALDAPQERRAFFAAWLTRPNNTLFTHSIVNRVWAHFMGRGLIEPVDDLRETNPPTNPALLDALAADFVRHKLDLRHLMRRIVTSRAYQRASEATPYNRPDDRWYSRYLVRRLTAEQLLDALGQVTGQRETFPGLPAGTRAIQLPDTHVPSEFMDSFGRPARQITCECERSQEPNTAQALLFLNSETVNKKVTADGGLVDRLVQAGKSDTELLETLYWTTLGRPPAPAEKAANLAALSRALQAASLGNPKSTLPRDARRRAFEDLLWALVNSKEFLFNH